MPPALNYRIPIVEREQLAAPNNRIPWDTQHPLFDEPMIRIEPLGIAFESYHAIARGDNPPYFRRIEGSRRDGWLRKTFAEKLVAVNAHLRAFGVELFVFDAYRSMECQRGLWRFFYERGRKELPEGSDREWTQYALLYVRDPRNFDPQNSSTFPAHATGAAIDATLRDLKTHKFLNMGSEFEEIIDVSYTDWFERQLQAGLIDANDERLQNRRLMHWALSKEGFVSDPILFWHYDWGDQPYVKVLRALQPAAAPPAAWYGYIDPPPLAADDAELPQTLRTTTASEHRPSRSQP